MLWTGRLLISTSSNIFSPLSDQSDSVFEPFPRFSLVDCVAPPGCNGRGFSPRCSRKMAAVPHSFFQGLKEKSASTGMMKYQKHKYKCLFLPIAQAYITYLIGGYYVSWHWLSKGIVGIILLYWNCKSKDWTAGIEGMSLLFTLPVFQVYQVLLTLLLEIGKWKVVSTLTIFQMKRGLVSV